MFQMVDGGPESVQMVLGLAPNEFYIVVYIYIYDSIGSG